MRTDLACMECKTPVDVNGTEEFIDIFLQSKIREEMTFMLNSKKKIRLQDKINSLRKEKEYFEKLGCIYAFKFYDEQINSLSINRFAECTCGDMLFDDGENVSCTCGIKKCSKCKTDSTQSHKCDINILKSEEEIQKNSVGCPGCGIPTFKVDGCYQVMCPECNCVFDYNTGKIDKSGVHAPEIFKQVRQLELDFKMKPLDWKEINDSRVIDIFIKISELLTSALNKTSINEENRIAFLRGEIPKTLFEERTLTNYIIYYQKKKEAKILLLRARRYRKRA